MAVSNIIGVDQLRHEIGAHEHQAGPGYISDDMLQGIIDRHADQLKRSVEQLMVEQGASMPDHLTQEMEFTLSAGDHPNVKQSSLSSVLFPFANEGYIESPASLGDITLSPDVNLFRTVRKSFSDIYRFNIYRNTLYVTTQEVEKVKLFLGIWDEVVGAVAPNLLQPTNQSIVQSAQAMLQARKQEYHDADSRAMGLTSADLQNV